MKRITTMMALAASVALSGTAPVQAAQVHVGIHIGNDRPAYRYNTGRIGYDDGYRDGLREGARDDRRDDRYNYRDERLYRQGDAGYRREYGQRYEYVSSYRRGFEEGYRQAYSNRWDRRDHRRDYRR
jgi:hypothetical protein